MGIIQRVPWTVQPQVGVGINRSNALAQGLCLGIDAVRGAYLGNNNSQLSVLDALPTQGGVSRRFLVSSNTKNIFPQGTSTASITMLQVGLIGTGTAQNTPFTLSHNGTSNTLAIEHSDGVTAGKVRGRVYVGGYQYCGGSVTLPAGSVYTAVLRHTNGVGQALWLNGVKDSVTTSATGATLGNTYYGAYSASSVEYGLLNLIWNRALSDAEIAALSANPWQLFAPLQRTIWVPVSAGGGSFQPAWARNSNTILIGGRA